MNIIVVYTATRASLHQRQKYNDEVERSRSNIASSVLPRLLTINDVYIDIRRFHGYFSYLENRLNLSTTVDELTRTESFDPFKEKKVQIYIIYNLIGEKIMAKNFGKKK